DAFGNMLSAREQRGNPFRYAGEMQDALTGHYYLRARFYNPQIARFTQEDTYRGDGLNLYAYVANNPIRYVDPSGYAKSGSGGTPASCVNKGLVFDSDYEIRGYRQRDLSKYPSEYIVDPRLMLEMDFKGKSSSGTNAAGWERSSKKFFNQLLKNNPEYWSESNTRTIKKGRVPTVDEHFLQYFPQYEKYLNDPMRHHHIGEGGQAVAVPLTLHPGYGGIHNIEKEWGITGVDDNIADRLSKF
ncbi:RHS repeat-associated core domain-containing protein, partial [Paenibacillus tundrae]